MYITHSYIESVTDQDAYGLHQVIKINIETDNKNKQKNHFKVAFTVFVRACIIISRYAFQTP